MTAAFNKQHVNVQFVQEYIHAMEANYMDFHNYICNKIQKS